MMGARITTYPHMLTCPHCAFVIRGKFAWRVTRLMRKHRENVHGNR